jgi:hypothetical protein
MCSGSRNEPFPFRQPETPLLKIFAPYNLVFGAGIELPASTGDAAIAETTEIAAMRDWPEFEILDGTRILFKMRRHRYQNATYVAITD